jgi:hypothetical protein
MDNVSAEIARVKAAIKKTDSPYLRRDYQKYLKKLYRRKKAVT